jgi:hypothetical protein
MFRMSGDELREQLREMARAVPREPGAGAEKRLLMAFRARQRRRKRGVWLIAMQAAACLTLIVGIKLAISKIEVVAQGARRQQASNSEVSAAAGDLTGFVALPYAQSGVPMDEGIVVRVRAPASQLSLMGVPFVSATPNGQVQADLLIGQDGVARAVRFGP